MGCPVCNGREYGKIGTHQFFCWNCLIEFNDQNETFQIGEDGSLLTTSSQT